MPGSVHLRLVVSAIGIVISASWASAAGGFKIDHPLDLENKYLNHSFVESPDMKNLYDGVVTADAKGIEVRRMPDRADPRPPGASKK